MRLRTLRLVVLHLVVAVGCRTPAEPERGDRKGPRVITLMPSATEIVAAAGGLELLVGVDSYSSYPPQVKGLPVVGDYLTSNFEAIVRLRPDLVVLDADQTSIDEGLRGAGIRTLPLPMETVADVRAALLAVGAAIGRRELGEQALAALDAELAAGEATAERARAGGPHPRVLVVIDRSLGGVSNVFAAGPGTFLDELVRRAGGVNVLADSPVRNAKISAEEILRGAPDIILDAVHTDDAGRAVRDWDELAAVPAVKNGRVYVLGDTMFVTPGPRLGEALRRIVAAMYPAPH